MGAVASVIAFFSVIALGLSAGALLAEGAILVPFWRSLPPESFLGWYREHASLLQRFFGPLQIAAFALAAVAAALRWFVRGSASPFLVLAALLAFAVLVQHRLRGIYSGPHACGQAHSKGPAHPPGRSLGHDRADGPDHRGGVRRHHALRQARAAEAAHRGNCAR